MVSHVNEKLQVIDLYGATIDEAARVVLTNAKGEFVQFVTPNCVLSDNFVDHTVSYLITNTQVDFVAWQTLFATESGHELSPYHLGSHVPNQSIVSKTAALTEALSNSESHKVDSQAGLHELLCREQRGHKLPEAITYYRFNGNCRHHHMMYGSLILRLTIPPSILKKVKHSVRKIGRSETLLLNF